MLQLHTYTYTYQISLLKYRNSTKNDLVFLATYIKMYTYVIACIVELKSQLERH